MKDNPIVRRRFIQYSTTSLGIITTSNIVHGAVSNEKQARSAAKQESPFDANEKSTHKADVLVVGGGAAGIIASIQSARAGAQTILVECNSQLGGTTTTGGVSFPGLFHAHGKQVIKGIGWELVKETVEMNSDVLQDFTRKYRGHVPYHININRDLYSLLAEEKCIKAGVQLRYYETPIKATFNKDHWIVDVVGKGTLATIHSKQLIDCTGNALLTQMAGYNVLRSQTCQPGSQMFQLDGYDPEKLNKRSIHEAYKKALEEGLFKKEEWLGALSSKLKKVFYKNSKGTSSNHIFGADSTTSETHTETNIKGRKALLKMLRFLRTLPGLEKTTIHSMCSETSIRETFRIDGMHKITVEEYSSGKQFKDGVCHSFYPIDLHNKNGVKPKPLKPGIVPTIPLRALVPRESKNFLVAGRCVSSDQLANSALRVQASCMAMGQAAGATAALAVEKNTTPVNVPLKDIREILSKHDAIIPKGDN